MHKPCETGGCSDMGHPNNFVLLFQHSAMRVIHFIAIMERGPSFGASFN